MQVLKLDHLGIAVKNLEDAIKIYEDLGLKIQGVEEVKDQRVKVAFIPIGDTEIELLESTSEDGPIAKFIEKNGEGVQHLAFKVENVEEAIFYMKEKGYRMIDETPRYGAGKAKIAFIHPKGTKGVLIELSQR